MPETNASPPIRTLGRTFFRRRPRVVAGAAVLALAAMTWGGVPRWQLAVVALGFSIGVALFAWEAARADAVAGSPRALRGSMIRTGVLVTLACVATGALGSPILPLLLAPFTGLLLVSEPKRAGVDVALSFGTLGAVLVLATVAAPFPPLPAMVFRILAGTTLVATGLLVHALVSGYARESGSAQAALAGAQEALLEETRTRAAALEQVGARLSHELRNPLAAIKGLVALEAEGAPGERSRMRFDVVQGEIGRLEALLAEYLAFTRSGAPLRIDPVSLGRSLEELRTLLEPRAARAGVTLALAPTDLTLDADPARLKELLLNLVVNAIEATPSGGTVRIAVDAAPDMIAIHVRDSGHGMPPDVLARIGTPFFTTRDGGHGLGVAIARSTAMQHGGTLTYESTVGLGTVATLTLPRRAAATPRVAS